MQKTFIFNFYEAAEKAVDDAVKSREMDRTTYEMNGWNKESGGLTKVNCFLDICEYNQNHICTKDEITLDKEHSCTGGCDYGWEIKDEDDED